MNDMNLDFLTNPLKYINDVLTAHSLVRKQYIIALRGASGSGKTTLAIDIQNNINCQTKIWAADDYFDIDGQYNYDFSKIKEAHQVCVMNMEDSIKNGYPVVIHNTNIKDWELDNIRRLAKEYQIPLMIVTLKKQYGNVHGVPEVKVQQMIENLKQSNITLPKGFTTVDSFHSEDYDAVLCIPNSVKSPPR